MSKSDVINLGMRMVVPVRHEFGRSIQVEKLFDDREYARTIIDLVSQSENKQLRDQGTYLAAMIFGPRSQPESANASGAQPAEAPHPSEQGMAQNRYRMGLR